MSIQIGSGSGFGLGSQWLWSVLRIVTSVLGWLSLLWCPNMRGVIHTIGDEASGVVVGVGVCWIGVCSVVFMLSLSVGMYALAAQFESELSVGMYAVAAHGVVGVVGVSGVAVAAVVVVVFAVVVVLLWAALYPLS